MGTSARSHRHASIPVRLALASALALTAAATGCGGSLRVEGRRVSEWVIALHATDPRERIGAARALAGFGARARLGIKPLVAALRDPVIGVREQAAYALGAIGGEATAFVAPILTETALDPETARFAALALARIGRNDASARAALVAAAGAADLVPRVAATRVLGVTGDATLATRLIEQLGGTEPAAQRDAALSLARMGSAGRAAIPTLIGLVRVDDRDLALGALTALGAVARGVDPASNEAHAVASAIAAAAPHRDALVRVAAARTAGELGAVGARSLGELGTLLADSQPPVRVAAAHAVAALAPAVSDERIAALVHLATTPGDEAPRVGAIRALGALGARAASATEPLAALAKERDADLKRAAAEALGKIVTARTKAVPAA